MLQKNPHAIVKFIWSHLKVQWAWEKSQGPVFRKKIYIAALNEYLITYSMEKSPSSEANSLSASQEIPRI